MTNALESGIEEGARAAASPRWGATTRRPAVHHATGSPQRVGAFLRVTRSAKVSACYGRGERAGATRRTLHGDRRKPTGLWFDAGGPSPLTEDRQKPRCRQCGAFAFGSLLHSNGWHGTRNTVLSRARIHRMQGL